MVHLVHEERVISLHHKLIVSQQSVLLKCISYNLIPDVYLTRDISNNDTDYMQNGHNPNGSITSIHQIIFYK